MDEKVEPILNPFDSTGFFLYSLENFRKLLLCSSSKGFMKAFKAFIKPFEEPQRNSSRIFLGGIEGDLWHEMG